MNRPTHAKLIGHSLIQGEANEQLKLLPDGSFKLVVTSPPYNIEKEYERNEFVDLKDYLLRIEEIVDLLVRKVSVDGSICWQVGNYVKDGEIIPLDVICYDYFKKRGMKLRNRIIWRFNFGLHATRRFSGRYETLLWFTKSDDYTFNLDPVRIPQLYPGKRHPRKKGILGGLPSGNPLGKNPSDYWEFDAAQGFKGENVWDIPNVKSNHPEKTIHPCQFPIELVERCVLALSNEGDSVLDPFVGTGTTVLACLSHYRNCCGIDRQKKYLRIAEKRIQALENGVLKKRPLGKTVYAPNKRDSVAQIPAEWIASRGKKADGNQNKIKKKKTEEKSTVKGPAAKARAKRSKTRGAKNF